MENIVLKSKYDYQLALAIYEVEGSSNIVQVIHGMEEHKERYDRLARFLNEKGYTVVLSDMRGHGKNAPVLGYFAKKDGYKLLLEDQRIIRDYIEERFKPQRVSLFAHSMGTIIARNLLQTSSFKYDKVILSGFPNPNKAAGFGVFVAKTIALFKGDKYKSKLIVNLSVGSFNKKIKNPRTKSDWLSVNEKNVDEHINDPLCGIGFTTSAYKDLFTLVKKMTKVKEDVNKELPFLLVYGEEDPATGGIKGVKNSIKALNKQGYKNLEDIGFKNMRHEILFEEKYTDVLDAIGKFLG